MKVTVCFGSVRVVVPCGSGNFLVGELINRAITRYKKAICKPPDYWVTVHNLKSSGDGGILDPDDELCDVADDREQIIAIFEEQGAPPVPHNGGDGTSASSVGTSSPDIFQSREHINNNNNKEGFSLVKLREGTKNDVIVTRNDLNAGCGLVVRRGSEPALNNFGKNVPNADNEEEIFPWQPVKRWSAISSADDHKSPRASENSDENNGNVALPPLPTRIGGNGQEKENGGICAFTAFSRNPIRRSLANNATMFQWLEAQQRQQQRFEQHSRKEPLGGSGKPEDEQREEENEKHRDSSPKSSKDSPMPEGSEIGLMVCMRNTGGPLGIHVVPDYDDNGRDMGLVIQGIEPGGRIHDDGRLHSQDRIIEINGTSLVDIDFNKAQDIFKQALQASEIKLRVIASAAPALPSEPPPTRQKQLTRKKPPNLDLSTLSPSIHPQEDSPAESPDVSTPTDSGPCTSTPTSKSSVAVTPLSSKAGSLPGSPSKKLPPAVPTRHPTTMLSTTSTPPKANIIAPTNTKKIGKKIAIELTKGSDGLGFSVTTRDNPACGVCPIYIKNILPKGAAIQDGRLKPGDRLLEVNGTDMTGLTQGDAVSMLKATKTGAKVNLVVSRQVAVEEKYAKTKHLKTSSSSSDKLMEEERGESKGKQKLALDIPLSDSGLGVSVKGKTQATSHGLQDLGIFIKSVITGGAASKDGRLQVDDQIIEVNGESLIGKSNTAAMGILRGAMQRNCITKRYISVVVRRERQPPGGRSSSYVDLQPTSPEEQRISTSDAPPFLQAGAKRTANKQDSGSPMVAGTRTISKSGGQNQIFANPLLGHLSDGNGLRNTSYQMATHDSLNEDDSDDQRKAVLNELDSAIEMRRKQNSKAARPSSTIGFLHPPTPDATGAMTSRSTALMEEEDEGAPKPPDWLLDWEKKQDKEPLSPEEEEAKIAFRREGFARQSMSEKRKNKLNDPRLLEFYQKVKEVKGKKEGSGSTHQYYSGGSTDVPSPGSLKRAGSAESLLSKNNSQSTLFDSEHDFGGATCTGFVYYDSRWFRVTARRKPASLLAKAKLHGELGPTLGLRKSSSLESLQSAVQEVSMEEDGSHFWKPPNRGMVRGRGCNESFRAAVDRSYENSGMLSVAEAMEPLEEEGSEYGHQDHRSRASSISNSEVVAEGKKAGKKPRKDKEKGGIFKGLGSMFRFGRHRKPLEDRGPKQTATEMHRQREISTRDRPEITTGHTDKHDGGKVTQAEQQRLQDQYRHLQEQPCEPDYQRMCAPPKGAQQWGPRGPPESRAARIQQLRAEHQQRHRDRQGQYPHDDEEDNYEHEIQQWEKTAPQRYEEYAVPSRRRAPLDDPYERMRVGRASHSAAADLDHYSHYQNFHEIQKELRRHDYYQQQYRSYIAQQQAQLDRVHKGAPPQYDGRRWDESGHATHDARIHSMQDLYSYGRQYSNDHLRQWGGGGYRTRGGSSETEPPSRYPRSSSTGGQMPISQLGYLPYPGNGSSAGDARTSGTLIAPPQVHVTGNNMFQLKAEYVGYDPSWAAYAEPSYSSLPRQSSRDRHRNQNGHVSTSAQV